MAKLDNSLGQNVLVGTVDADVLDSTFSDADGSGADAPQLLATLQGAPNLVATDLHVIA